MDTKGLSVVVMVTHLRARERRLPYRITQCYLVPNTEWMCPALTPAMQASTQFTYPGLMSVSQRHAQTVVWDCC